MKSITFNIPFPLKVALILTLVLPACKITGNRMNESIDHFPENYSYTPRDQGNAALVNWRDYFKDSFLIQLIDTALRNNQELNIILHEISISNNEILASRGNYLPFVDAGIGMGSEKTGQFTRNGAVEHNLPVKDGKEFPEPLSDLQVSAMLSWEVDIWHKLRNERDAAQLRYLAQTEGKNFLLTCLVAEIAELYYHLIAYDNLQMIIDRNVILQSEALEKMRMLKENAQANQLAVNRFEAQLFNTKNRAFALRQKIVETENRINYLTGRYPQPIRRSSSEMMNTRFPLTAAGAPTELLENRPDIKQALFNLRASGLDVASAKANFFPQLHLSAGLGFQAFNPRFIFNPESLMYNAAGDLLAPLINRKAIQAEYYSATSRQIQRLIEFQQSTLIAYTDVINQLSKMDNYTQSVEMKSKEVQVLNTSVIIANNLFQFAKANYVEVLLTQEEVLNAEMELVETKLELLHAGIGLYKALGGGWK